MKHSLIRFSAVVLTIAFVFALTDCGSGSNSFTWFVDSIPANLDPQVASASADVIACENLYSGLVRKDPSGKYEPALCERWEKSSDGLTYTFYLKDGLTYTAAKGNTRWSLRPLKTAPPCWPGRCPRARWESWPPGR